MKVINNNEEKMCLIEVNSVATGSMSFPSIDTEFYNQYDYIIQESFLPLISHIKKEDGVLAVLDDAFYPEGFGYATSMAKLSNEPVFHVNLSENYDSYFRINNDYLEIIYDNKWRRIRACYKYVQTRPWLKLPVYSKTFIYNSLLACLAGGRNKAIASLAYENFNKESPIKIRHPLTITNLTKEGVIKIAKDRGMGVAKGLYGNGGEEVFFLMDNNQIENFSKQDLSYNNYIYQDLIGLRTWFKDDRSNRYYHVGTAEKDKKVFDIRTCVAYTENGFRPSSIFSRKAKSPLKEKLEDITDYKKVLSTNIGGSIDYDNQVVILDEEGFAHIGVKLENLIDAFIQTVLGAISIDMMACSLMKDNQFDHEKYLSLNHDEKLYEELKSKK
jgi:hypothetical protein